MLSRPDHLRIAHPGHEATAVLNLRTGQWVWLDEDTRRIWDAALSGGSALRTLIDSVCARGFERAQVETATEAIVDGLRASGLLHSAPRPRPASRRWWRVILCR
ncbi:PqqD family protein [Streptomyces sp. NPDC088745]|uniref:PqqD family protein n=1 Tax=Streptomyces sp. NPDC088745 TaxID=3365884 RepID=UPI00380FD0DA